MLLKYYNFNYKKLMSLTKIGKFMKIEWSWFCLQDVLKKGTGGWKKAVACFGEEILLSNGEVDRPKLGQIVFSDPDKRQLLNRYK